MRPPLRFLSLLNVQRVSKKMSGTDGGTPVHRESDHSFAQAFRNLSKDLRIVVVRNLVGYQQVE